MYIALLKSSDYNTLRLDLLVVLIQLAYYQNNIQVYNSTNMLDRVPSFIIDKWYAGQSYSKLKLKYSFKE